MIQNNEYFFLNHTHILHKGISGYAIYDLLGGDLITLNQELGSVLEVAEKGSTLSEIAQNLCLNKNNVIEMLTDIALKKIGDFFPTRIFIEKYKLGQPYKRHPVNITGIQKCFVELPGECHANCTFCRFPALFSCNKCNRVTDKPDLKLVNKFLDRVFQMNCRRLIFHGGDPISDLNQFEFVVKRCREQDYQGEIYVITNGTLLNNEILNLFSNYQVQPVIPLFLEAPILSEDKIIDICTIAHQKNIKFVITAGIFENNPDFSKLNDLVNKLSPKQMWTTAIYNKNLNNNSCNYPNLLNLTTRVTADKYYHNSHLHPCLWGTIALSVNGDVLPCPHLKTEVLGNMEDPYCIDNLFEDESRIFKYWEWLRLLNIPRCKHCEFNIGCLDCRAFEMQATGDLYGKVICSLDKNIQT